MLLKILFGFCLKMGYGPMMLQRENAEKPWDFWVPCFPTNQF
jgi:hypothetical protein